MSKHSLTDDSQNAADEDSGGYQEGRLSRVLGFCDWRARKTARALADRFDCGAGDFGSIAAGFETFVFVCQHRGVFGLWAVDFGLWTLLRRVTHCASEIVLLNLRQERFVAHPERFGSGSLVIVVSSESFFYLLSLNQSHRAISRLAQSSRGVEAERFYIP